MTMTPLAELSRQLEAGETTGLALVSQCLERIADPAGEGARVFLATDPEAALAEAERADALRAEGRAPSPLAGIPVSIKALFDIEGMVTTSGSAILADAPPAKQDAEIVRRLRAAGLVILGHTNMTEFAYSGLGINPHYGTPANPSDPQVARIPGGSSSGAAVSVASGMASVAIGTDTGGSCRIPAAFCGLVGFKPTASRVPATGAFPLSHSLDSIGPIGVSVECCALIDAILAGEPLEMSPTPPLAGLRLAVLDNYVTGDVSGQVARAFAEALRRLEAAGASVQSITIPDLDTLPALNARGGIVAAEAYAVHKDMLAERREDYDPRVSARILKALEQGEGEYDELVAARRRMMADADAITAPYDAVLFPTVPFEAPAIADLEDDEAFGRVNLLTLRNPTVANILDRCAISIPLPVDGGLPVGLHLMGATGGDRRLLAVAGALEALFQRA